MFGAQKTGVPLGMRTAKVRLRNLRLRTRTLLAVGLETMSVMPQQNTCPYFNHVLRLWGTEIKGSGLIWQRRFQDLSPFVL